MWLPFNTKVWFYRQPIDFRKQIDGIVLLVSDTLHKDPTSGQLFVFRNKKADKIRMLYWKDNGFWLLYKRNEKSRFIFPGISNDAIELSISQLRWLLSGLDFTQQEEPEKLYFSHFY
ncbi:IS66 family insertion sequence element accessory protein TnpB [Microbulbifer sp. OS29]|uniref:IS66 family insertion sequence element accessory protein TnpB n=1 Tax=Microbulbifer okhotskensis TaxID=2926617 RepID=A0A9X2EQK1_9GAMM|nr:IS66 family insertion sequence element accessory protein TnpB [Microbulbifer okhotskensis]MCO1336562.1 IS66 family insertion sequence element accessory protein TnpB [Microbulbifer okhotskensis]